jgi:hypothetical protein
MKTEHVKTPATAEEVSARGVEERGKRHKSQRSATPCAREKTRADRKKNWNRACKSVEREENHEEGRAARGHEIKWEIPDI